MTLRIVCSKGTYIRALARDIGAALGSGAYLLSLRRTRIGDIALKDCLQVEDWDSWVDSIEIASSDNA
jgi:tRNA pseudouridine55 synthase